MSVKYTSEQVKKVPMIELAYLILTEKKEELNFIDLFNLVAKEKELSEIQKENNLARFYTDLNVDGRFTMQGKNVWGLKRWYAAIVSDDANEEEDLELDDEFEEEEEDIEDPELDQLVGASKEDYEDY